MEQNVNVILFLLFFILYLLIRISWSLYKFRCKIRFNKLVKSQLKKERKINNNN